MIPQFLGTIENGKLTIANRPEMIRYLQTLKGQVTVVIDKVKKGRSVQQNKYLWGVCYKIISDHTGYSLQEVHQICAKNYLSYEKESKLSGNTKEFIKSTTSLTVKEMDGYLEDIKRFASVQLNLFIPDPNQVDY